MKQEELLINLYNKQGETGDFVNLGKYPTEATKELETILIELKKERFADYTVPFQGVLFSVNPKNMKFNHISAEEGDLEARLTLKGKKYVKDNLIPGKKMMNPAWLIAIFGAITLSIFQLFCKIL